MNFNMEVNVGEQGDYYVLDNIKYHIRFPIDWAVSTEVPISSKYLNKDENENKNDMILNCSIGPTKCANCRHYGCIRDVFVGYCGNCMYLYHIYNLHRNDEEPDKYYFEYLKGLSLKNMTEQEMYDTYYWMQGIKKDDIGVFYIYSVSDSDDYDYYEVDSP